MVLWVSGSSHFRQRTGDEQRATWLELFFDLVFVFAVTQLSHLLLNHLTLRGVAADAVSAAGRLVGLDLHRLDDQLVRSRLRAGATGAAGGDGIELVDGRRHPPGFRRPGAALRLLLRRTPGAAKRVQRLRHSARQRLPHRLSPDPGLESGLGNPVAGRRVRASGRPLMAVGRGVWRWTMRRRRWATGRLGWAAPRPQTGRSKPRTLPSGSSSSSSLRWASRLSSPVRPRRRRRIDLAIGTSLMVAFATSAAFGGCTSTR